MHFGEIQILQFQFLLFYLVFIRLTLYTRKCRMFQSSSRVRISYFQYSVKLSRKQEADMNRSGQAKREICKSLKVQWQRLEPKHLRGHFTLLAVYPFSMILTVAVYSVCCSITYAQLGHKNNNQHHVQTLGWFSINSICYHIII